MTAASSPLAVTFDFWDTLVHAPSVTEMRTARRVRLVQALADAGVAVIDGRLEAAMPAVRRAFDEHWAANRQFTGHDSAALLLELLGASPDREALDLVADAVMGVGDDWVPDLTPNVEATLRHLKSCDVRLGIICDVGSSPSTMLRSYLEHHGVLGLFDHWSFSDEVGVYKPDPTIFRHALDGLGVDPARAAHVGDLRRTDVAGAIGFGMTAVRYAGSNDDVVVPGEGDRAMDHEAGAAFVEQSLPEAHHVIDDHAELPRVLGLA